MADLPHDASTPASSEPVGTAQQASGPASSDKGKLRVFISYSRDDLNFCFRVSEICDTRHNMTGKIKTTERAAPCSPAAQLWLVGWGWHRALTLMAVEDATA